MKILIFGGSFDPVHKGHISLLKSALNQIEPDRTHIFTAYKSPFKQISPTPYKIRRQMAQAAFKPLDNNIVIDDFEYKMARQVYTWQTIEYILKLYPSAKVFLLVGSDCLNDFGKWENTSYIFKNAVVAAGLRKRVKPISKFNFLQIKGNFPLVSSSETRLNILANGAASLFAPQEVKAVIENNLLYGLNIHKWLSANLVPARYYHIKCVCGAALNLAREFNVNQYAAVNAALLHDAAKYMHSAGLIKYCVKHKLKMAGFKDIRANAPILLHGVASAYIAKTLFNIKDKNILNAIKCHTLGSANMSALDKILFVADVISKDRPLRFSKKIRQAALKSLDAGLAEAAAAKLMYSIESRKWIASNGIKLWNKTVLENK